jgi:hypothetical protein
MPKAGPADGALDVSDVVKCAKVMLAEDFTAGDSICVKSCH